ncbi:MAG TPA: hypothetical protein VFQ68_24150 [Streptosporangiaceae bacterium]|nr:hypothetical protein [Streptosporangiaceae bacterium]
MSLTVVKDSPPPRRRKPASVQAAAAGGSRRELLTALRSRIAAGIDNPKTPPRDLAALSLRLLDIARELELLDAAEKADGIGEAAATPDQRWAAP